MRGMRGRARSLVNENSSLNWNFPRPVHSCRRGWLAGCGLLEMHGQILCTHSSALRQIAKKRRRTGAWLALVVVWGFHHVSGAVNSWINDGQSSSWADEL